MTKFADLPEEERRRKFEQWVSSREEKTAKNKVKNAARKVVIDAHKPEYDELVKAEAKNIKVKDFTQEEAAKILEQAKEKKVKSKSRAKARTAILNKYKDEFVAAQKKAEKAG